MKTATENLNPAIDESYYQRGDHAHAVEQSEAILKRRAQAEQLGKKAQDHLAKKAAAESEIAAIRAEFKNLHQQFERCHERTIGARESLKFFSERVSAAKAKVVSRIGHAGYPSLGLLEFARRELVAELLMVELAREAIAEADRELSELKPKIAEFGKAHGLPEDVMREMEN